MLCSLKIRRPDKLLQKRLLQLAYTLIILSISIILFMLYPEYYIYSVISMLVLSVLCLGLTIKTLQAGEEAISYGGFANEIIKNDFKARRIDNAQGEPVIQNDVAKELLKNEPILEYLEKQLSENRNNKAAFYRLQTACRNLSSERVTLGLNLHHEEDKVFAEEEWFDISVRPIFLKKADIFEGAFSIKAIKKDTYLYWNFQDITASKNMERVFQEERQNLHDFLDYIPVGLYTCAKNFEIEYANHAFAKLVGLPREDIIGTDFRKYLGENQETPQNTSWSGRQYFVNSAKEATECFVIQESFRSNKEYKLRGAAVAGIPSDRDTKKELSSCLDKISWLFNAAPVGIIFINREGKITDCNVKVKNFLKTEKEKILYQSIFNYIKEEDRAELEKKFTAIYASVTTSESLDVHINFGQEEHIIQLYISPMRKFYSFDISDIDGIVLYMIDATQQKTLELQFAQAQKMQALGQLAGGVSHDFNNLLTAMIGFCDLLLQRHGVGDPSFSDLMQIKHNASRAAGLVRQLLAFSRKQPLKPKLIDVTENFVELSHMLKRILGEQIVLEFYHGTDLGYIRVDPVQFSQVIINLAVNAKDAMNGHGRLSISTRVEALTEPYQFGADTIKPGEFVVIDVKDTGCGIPPENLTRIFEPFFSTKQNVVGSGTGLGLATVYGIVRQTEGFIKVDSKVGAGTTFSIHLPRFDSLAEEDENKNPVQQDNIKAKDGSPVITVQEQITSPIALNQKLIFGLNISAIDRSIKENPNATSTRILFVEDEDSVRSFGVRALKKKGFDVVACNSAENALEQLAQDKNFGLLITDMVMPGINGAELAGKVREQIANIKIILASGYSEEIARRELAGSQDFDFLAKPFSLGDLTKKVFDVLSKN